MRHKNKISKLGRRTDHRGLMLRNLATSIILYEKVKTTQAKAKAVAPIVEGLITTVKTKPETTAIREVNAKVLDKNASRKLMQELKKRYEKQTSGYTKVSKIGYRESDASLMVQIELVK